MASKVEQQHGQNSERRENAGQDRGAHAEEQHPNHRNGDDPGDDEGRNAIEIIQRRVNQQRKLRDQNDARATVRNAPTKKFSLVIISKCLTEWLLVEASQ